MSSGRRHTSGEERALLRRLTITTAMAAAGLNAALFIQSGIQQVGPGDFQNAIVAALSSVFPSGGLHSASQAPSPSPGGTGVVTTGGS